MTSVSYNEMLQYLQDNFSLSEKVIETALHRSGQDFLFLPMVLWQYDLLTLKQLDSVYDWLATECTRPIALEPASSKVSNSEAVKHSQTC